MCMPSPCPNCGNEFDQCMPWNVCPKCGHFREKYNEHMGIVVKETKHWCKICKKYHKVIEPIPLQKAE